MRELGEESREDYDQERLTWVWLWLHKGAVRADL